MNQLERYRGCLLGLAVGDATGTTVEFRPPGSFKPTTDMIGGGPFRLKAGEWTDDTSMALCLVESLIEKRRFDAEDQLKKYVRWYPEGHLSSKGRCVDIGTAVLSALHRFENTREPYCGSTDPESVGNGSIMRLAPVPLYYARNPRVAMERSGESSRTTHGTAACVDACRYFGGLLVGAVNGVSKEELLQRRDVALHSVQERLDTGSASGRLFFNILSAMATWEREIISERTVIALSVKRTSTSASPGTHRTALGLMQRATSSGTGSSRPLSRRYWSFGRAAAQSVRLSNTSRCMDTVTAGEKQSGCVKYGRLQQSRPHDGCRGDGTS